MAEPATRRMTVAEFFAWAQTQPERYELVDGEVFAMAPERNRHGLVKLAAAIALRQALRGRNCVVMPDGATIVVDESTSYEADAAVQCGGRFDPDGLTMDAPVILVEVLSPSTRSTDTGRKLVDYFRLPSVRHYLVLDAARKIVTWHARREDGSVETRILTEGTLRLDPPGAEVEVAAFFADLPPDPPSGPG